MNLKSHLQQFDPVKAFEKWLKENPKGGIFEWQGQKFKVTLRK